MPRVENLGENVQAWCDASQQETGTTYDVCAACFRVLQEDPHAFDRQLLPRTAGEPRGADGWGGDIEHPPYAYATLHCAACGVDLTFVDDRRSLTCCSGATPEAACISHRAAIRVKRGLRH
jgi:hypothetical protein